jgi:hypothetical protein
MSCPVLPEISDATSTLTHLIAHVLFLFKNPLLLYRFVVHPPSDVAAVHDIPQKQRAVTEFLVCENENAGNILKQVQKEYRQNTVNQSIVSRWTQKTSGEEGGHANIHN